MPIFFTSKNRIMDIHLNKLGKNIERGIRFLIAFLSEYRSIMLRMMKN